MKKVAIFAVVSTLLVVSLITISVVDDTDAASFSLPTSGSCGENIKWNYDHQSKTLTISGAGPMDDVEKGRWTYDWSNLNPQYQVKHVVMKGSISTIGKNAFRSCTLLESITMPDSVVRINDGAFSYCSKLTNITIPDSVKELGDAFTGCNALTTVTLSDQITSLNMNLFSGCTKLTEVKLPRELIEFDGFSGCTKLKVDLNQCPKLKTVTLRQMNQMSNVDIPDSVTTVNLHSDYITEINLGDSVSSFNDYNAKNLKNISVSPKNQQLKTNDGVLYSNDMAELKCYPEGKTATSFKVPDSVVKVDHIRNKFLTSLTFGESVVECGYTDCKSLQILNVPAGMKGKASLPSKIACIPMDYKTTSYVSDGTTLKYYSEYIDSVVASPTADGKYRIHVNFNQTMNHHGIRIGTQYNLSDIQMSQTNDFILDPSSADFMKIYLSVDTGVDEVPLGEYDPESEGGDIDPVKLVTHTGAVIIAVIIIAVLLIGGGGTYIIIKLK